MTARGRSSRATTARWVAAVAGALLACAGGAAFADRGPGGGGGSGGPGGGGGWHGGGGAPMRGSPGPGSSGNRDSGGWREAPRDSGGWRDGSRGPGDMPARGGSMGRGYYERSPGYVVRVPRYYAPPRIGFTVAILPPYYTTLWYGGLPYFYADGAYFMWRERERHYEVVEAPAGAASRAPASSPDDLFVYPKQGQSENQQSKDRYECHRWAVDQTTWDPTQPSGGLSQDESRAKRDEYRRAMSACLESRGYTVR